MPAENPNLTSPDLPPGWKVPRPEKLPEPTAWPAMLALAITLLVWGLIASLILTGVGFLVFAGALAGWMQDIRHERNEH